MGRLVGVEAAPAHHPRPGARATGGETSQQIGLGQEEVRRMRTEGERVPQHGEEPGNRAMPPPAGAQSMDGDAARREHIRDLPGRTKRDDAHTRPARGEGRQHGGEMSLRPAKAKRGDDDEEPEAPRQLSHPGALASRTLRRGPGSA